VRYHWRGASLLTSGCEECIQEVAAHLAGNLCIFEVRGLRYCVYSADLSTPEVPFNNASRDWMLRQDAVIYSTNSKVRTCSFRRSGLAPFAALFSEGAASSGIAGLLNNELAGYALVSLRKGACAARIYSIAVDERLRSTAGSVSRLLMACENMPGCTDATDPPWRCATDNKPAIALYEKSDFHRLGEHGRILYRWRNGAPVQKALIPCHEPRERAPHRPRPVAPSPRR